MPWESIEVLQGRDTDRKVAAGGVLRHQQRVTRSMEVLQGRDQAGRQVPDF
jgi:hypothetical protein